MPETNHLSRQFYEQNTLDVARHLLGALLVRKDQQYISGIIVETEAYRGEQDLGCHARAGLTNRTRIMYGPPGHAYIYFTYGMHWCLNCVTEAEGFPAAVLLRAIIPIKGVDEIAKRRSRQPRSLWTNGPAKICQALDIDGRLNGIDLCKPDNGLWIEPGQEYPNDVILKTPRIGLNNVPEPWKSVPWRFVLRLDETAQKMV